MERRFFGQWSQREKEQKDKREREGGGGGGSIFQADILGGNEKTCTLCEKLRKGRYKGT